MSAIVSIIVASHRPDLLRGLINSLMQQDFEKSKSEIIIVTDFIHDSLPDEYPHVIWKYLHNRSISAKRNLGVSVSKCDIIAFIDDDCIAESHWLKKGVEYMAEHKDIAAVEGLTTIEHSEKVTGAFREYRRLEQPGFRTNNIFYRKDIFLKAGGFDERFTVQREDIDLAFSVLEMGCKIDHDPQIRVQHRFRHWERWDLLKNCWNRRFDPLLFRKHSGRYRSHIGSPFPPGIITLLGIYILLPFSFQNRSLFSWVVIVNLILVAVMAVKRTGIRQFDFIRFTYETISAVFAPLTLLGALIYGSLRFRKLLLF